MDYAMIQPYIAQGLIKEQRHPQCYDLAIFNYTPACQFTERWDAVTMACRGLILNTATGEIVARPFSKFHNLEEHLRKGRTLPREIPHITEKMDGSLGLLYWLEGCPYIATRGSFVSEQAQWAKQWLWNAWRVIPAEMQEILRDPSVTHLFEIIAPVSRVVVRYGYEGLVYLATLDKSTGHDMQGRRMPFFRYPHVFRMSSDDDLHALQQRDEANAEGYVALFPVSGLRIKIKFATYVRWHKILTGLSEKGIWELLKDGTDTSAMLDGVPGEWLAWFDATKGRLQQAYQQIEEHVMTDWDMLCISWAFCEYRKETHRKEMALGILKKWYPSVLFARLDGKAYGHQIWKMIEPKGKTTFHGDVDHG